MKDHNNKSGHGRITFPFYDQMDRILGDKPSVTPRNILDSSREEESLDGEDTDIPTGRTFMLTLMFASLGCRFVAR